MNILFANTIEPACGVHQFGVNFFNNLHSKQFSYFYDQPTSIQDVSNFIYEEDIKSVIVNWHPDIGGWQKEIGFLMKKHPDVKFVLSYHDGETDLEDWDVIIFSDPTMKDHGKWFSVPRPIPKPTKLKILYGHEETSIGCHGFYGASANMVVKEIAEQWKHGDIYLYVPVASYGDRDAKLLLDVLRLCSEITEDFPGIRVIPDFRFHSTQELIAQLSRHTINCYFRPTEPEWKGVSSALDLAVASGRPLAINKCKGFRHMHNLIPSICIEDRSLSDILDSGTKPLKPFIEANTPEKLTEKVDYVMRSILG